MSLGSDQARGRSIGCPQKLASEPRDRGSRVLDRVGDCTHEAGCGAAVADTMIERKGHLSDAAHHDLAVHYPGSLDDAAESEDGDLGVVDDGRAAADSEVAVVVECEGA